MDRHCTSLVVVVLVAVVDPSFVPFEAVVLVVPDDLLAVHDTVPVLHCNHLVVQLVLDE